jgi:hypothetical protein
MNCISYAIFGNPHVQEENCFSFHSYMRGLMINLRLNRLLFPGWDSVIHVNQSNPYKEFFESLNTLPNVRVIFCEDAPLCKAMLWRLKPIFEVEHSTWKYEHVICRDADSPTIYKDVQAVTYWMSTNRACHAITDSDGHGIPMMGGMVGFKPKPFTSITGCNTWDDLIRLGQAYEFNYSQKGSDQNFLNRCIYPLVSQPGRDSITQHYFEGMPNTHLSDYHTCSSCPRKASGHNDNCPNNVRVPISDELKESNTICGHIGAAGFYEGPLNKFLNNYVEEFRDIQELEAPLKESIFFWHI